MTEVRITDSVVVVDRKAAVFGIKRVDGTLSVSLCTSGVRGILEYTMARESQWRPFIQRSADIEQVTGATDYVNLFE